jgi:hypothetical protein
MLLLESLVMVVVQSICALQSLSDGRTVHPLNFTLNGRGYGSRALSLTNATTKPDMEHKNSLVTVTSVSSLRQLQRISPGLELEF